MGRKPYGPMTPERDREIADMYRSGMKLREIGDIWGFTRERARQILFKQGVIPNEIKRVSREKLRGQVVKLAHNGFSIQQIPAKLGLLGNAYKYAIGEHYRACELCETKFKVYQKRRHNLCLVCTSLHGQHWSHVKAMVKSHHPIMLKALNRLSKDWKGKERNL